MYTENRARSARVSMRMCSLKLMESELNFLFHLHSKTNLVTEKMCNLSINFGVTGIIIFEESRWPLRFFV